MSKNRKGIARKEEKSRAKKAVEEAFVPQQSEKGYFLWPLEKIVPNRNQPRKHFAVSEMESLKTSIEAIGIKEPILIHVTDKKGNAIIVDGERRFRVAKELGFGTIPAFLDNSQDSDLFQTSVVANFCREDMTEIEVANALKALIMKYKYTHKEVAGLVGKSLPWVYNMLKFLKLEPRVAKQLLEREITPNTALLVARFPEGKQSRLVSKVVDVQRAKGKNLTPQEGAMAVVRAAEELRLTPQKTKKGTVRSLDHKTLIVKKLTRSVRETLIDLIELSKIPNIDLQKVGGDHLSELEGQLKGLPKAAQKALERVENLD